MTNLLEKVLLTGFGIVILVLFFSFINPFIIQIFEINEDYHNEIAPYLSVIDDVNYGISYVQDNKDTQYLKTISYPENLNITLLDHNIKFHYLINSGIECRIYEYSVGFYNQNYSSLIPKDYIMNISFQGGLMKVSIY